MRRLALTTLLIAATLTPAVAVSPARAAAAELTRKDAADAVRRWARRCVKRKVMSGFKLIGAKRHSARRVLIRLRDWVDAPEGRLRFHYWVEARQRGNVVRVYPFPADSAEVPVEFG